MSTDNSLTKSVVAPHPILRSLTNNKQFYCSIGLIVLGTLLVAGIGIFASLSPARVFIVYSATTTVSYLLFLSSMVTELQFKNEQIGRNFVLAVALYIVYTALLTTQFAFAWGFGGGFGPPNSGNGFYPATADLVDALYFSITVFTTVGFGDYVPITHAAKLYFCFESMVAATHNAAFFSILLIRLTTSSKTHRDSHRRRK